jgi:hypothetical protein
LGTNIITENTLDPKNGSHTVERRVVCWLVVFYWSQNSNITSKKCEKRLQKRYYPTGALWGFAIASNKHSRPVKISTVPAGDTYLNKI